MGCGCAGDGENRGRGSAETEARVPRRPGPLSLVRTVQSGGTSLSCKYNNVQSPSADFVTLKTFSSLSASPLSISFFPRFVWSLNLTVTSARSAPD